jgi:hypothetical protein
VDVEISTALPFFPPRKLFILQQFVICLSVVKIMLCKTAQFVPVFPFYVNRDSSVGYGEGLRVVSLFLFQGLTGAVCGPE